MEEKTDSKFNGRAQNVRTRNRLRRLFESNLYMRLSAGEQNKQRKRQWKQCLAIISASAMAPTIFSAFFFGLLRFNFFCARHIVEVHNSCRQTETVQELELEHTHTSHKQNE